MQAQINNLISLLQEIDPKTRKVGQDDMAQAAQLLAAAIKGRVPIGQRATHSSYRKSLGGKKAGKGKGIKGATFKAGNLRKSFRVLRFRRSSAAFVGPSLGRKTKADGYYASWVEFGPSHLPNYTGRGYVAAGVAAAGATTLRLATQLLGQRIDNIIASSPRLTKKLYGSDSFFKKYAAAKGRQ